MVAFVQSAKFIVFKREDAVGSGFEVVEEVTESSFSAWRNSPPSIIQGRLGVLTLPSTTGPAMPKQRGIDRVIAGGEKFLQHRDQDRNNACLEIVLGLGAQLFAVHGKQREIGFGAADIARENEISMSHSSF